jgi:phytoene synthase
MTNILGVSSSDLAEVEDIVRRAGTSFYQGMRILPAERRAAMYAVYAFCRIVDDIADEPAPLAQKWQELAAWRERVAHFVHEKRGEDALTRVLAAATQKFDLREADFLAIIDGMENDAETDIIAPTEDELDLYCDRVAAAVGRLSVRVFGDGSENADRVAFHLGRALQLTNILRDLAEDAARNRLYLPRELLDAYAIPHDPKAALVDPNLGRVCARLANRAETHFEQSFTSMRDCNKMAMRPARAMAASYRAILDRLIARGWSDPATPAPVPKWLKLWIALRYSLAG